MATSKPKNNHQDQELLALNPKQKKFCDEYLVDFNATRAAIAAGYSKDTAKEMGYENLTKPHLKAYVQKKMEEASMSAEEATKLISDIAKGSLNNYFSVKKVENTPRIKLGLEDIINRVEAEIDFEEEFASLAGYDEEEKKAHDQSIANKKRQIIRYKIELKRNPQAYRIVDGPTELIDSVELDMVKLVADKERGRIKSISPTANGMKVELFSADAALVNVAKIHGLFEKDNEQLRLEATRPLSDDQVEKIINGFKTRAVPKKSNGK